MTTENISTVLHALPFLLQGAFVTVQITSIAITFGLLGGVCIGIANCRYLASPSVSVFLDGFIWVMRGTPLFVQVFIIYYALPELLGFSFHPFAAGVLALGVNSMAYVAEIVRGGIDSISLGQWEASYVLGLSMWKTLKGIILPQMFRFSLPSITNELISLIKESSVLMIIGVSELTKVSKDIVARELNPVAIYIVTAVFYLILTGMISTAVTYIKRRWHV